MCINFSSFGQYPESPISQKVLFEENKGQVDAAALFYIQTPTAHYYVEHHAFQYLFFANTDVQNAFAHPRAFEDEIKPYNIKGHALRVSFLYANKSPIVFGDKAVSGHKNYFIGDHAEKWATECRLFESLMMQDLYPNIDAHIYGNNSGNIKYDLLLKPNADASNIKIQYEGANSMSIVNGKLRVYTSINEWIEEAPIAYQMINGKKQFIPCAYTLNESNIVTFQIGEYDHSRLLVIDPELIFSTYSGSTVDNFGATATYDRHGNLYAAGISTGPLSGYPATAGAFDITYNGGQGAWPQFGFSCDITISKYNNDGTSLLYATYLGGNKNDYVHSLVVNNKDELIVLGTTLSANFPKTSLAFDTTYNDTFDIIVTKFNANGTAILGSTYVGGSGIDGISTPDTLCMNYMDHMRGEIQVTKEGDIVVGSVTRSANFPTTPGAFQPLLKGAQDGCVFKLDSTLRTMKWSSFIGELKNETLNGVELDKNGNIYLAGGTHSNNFQVKGNLFDSTYHGGISDAWVAKVNNTGDSLLQFMYWGSAGYDQAYFVRTDRFGNVYLFGQNFDSVAVTSGVYKRDSGSIFISSFTPSFDSLRFSTVIGNGVSKNVLVPSSFMVDVCGAIYGSLWAGDINLSSQYRNGAWRLNAPSSTFNLPITSNALQSNTDGEDFYFFVLQKEADSLLYASYYGENFGEDHVDGGTSRFDSRGIIYQSVCASCSFGRFGNFPTTANSYSPNNKSPRCSNASLKIDFRVSNVVTADFKIQPKIRCTDSVLLFVNNSYNANKYFWYLNDTLVDTTINLQKVYSRPGTHIVKLVAVDSTRCNIADSISKTFRVGVSVKPDYTVLRDTCSPVVQFKNLTISSTGDSIPVLWDFGDGTTSTLQNPFKEFANSDAYPVTLYVIDSAGCGDTVFQYVNYDRNAHLLTVILSPTDSISCEPYPILIFNFGRGGQQYRWYINDSIASTDRNLDTVLNKGIYHIKTVVIDSSTCAIKDSAQTKITVLPEVIPAFSIVRDSCSYTLHFNNESIMFPSDSVDFIWYFGDGDSSMLKNPPPHTYTGPGLYDIKLTVNKGLWCEYTATTTYRLDNNNLVLNADFEIIPNPACAGNIINFNNTSTNGMNHYWYLDSVLVDSTFDFQKLYDTTGIYQMTLIIFDTATCYKSDTISKSFSVLPVNKALFSVIRDTCSPNLLIKNLSDTSGNPNVTFLWKYGDGVVSTLFEQNYLYAQNGNYSITLIVNPGSPCADSLIIPIAYDSTAHVIRSFFEMNDSVFCLPADFSATNISLNNKYNRWYVNENYIHDSTDFDSVFTAPGSYNIKLYVMDSTTCNKVDSFSRTIVASISAFSDFEIARDSCSLEVTFINKSVPSPGQPTTYLWDFGDGDTSNKANPSHRFERTGTYTITLITNPGTVCADTATKTYYIDGDSTDQIVVPNVFTPNNDNLNDCFQVTGLNNKCDEYHIWIRNRWGNLFYESTNPEACWNGKNEVGVDASVGVYYYIIKIKKYRGKEYDLNGTITLFR